MIGEIALGMGFMAAVASAYLSNRQTRDILEIAAQQQADTQATILNALLTKTPQEFLAAQKITASTAVTQDTPRQIREAAAREQLRDALERTARQMGHPLPEAPIGLD